MKFKDYCVIPLPEIPATAISPVMVMLMEQMRLLLSQISEEATFRTHVLHV